MILSLEISLKNRNFLKNTKWVNSVTNSLSILEDLMKIKRKKKKLLGINLTKIIRIIIKILIVNIRKRVTLIKVDQKKRLLIIKAKEKLKCLMYLATNVVKLVIMQINVGPKKLLMKSKMSNYALNLRKFVCLSLTQKPILLMKILI